MPNFVTADELARNRYGSDPRLAGNEIGAALFGRGASRQAAVDKGTEQGLTLAEKFANARYLNKHLSSALVAA